MMKTDKMPPAGSEAFVTQLQKRDSILIADQLRYGVRIDGVQDGSDIALPLVKDTLMRDVLVVDRWKIDTLKTYKKQNTRDIQASLVITSFDEGEYLLPGIPVIVRRPDGQLDTLRFKGQDVLFCTMPVDTASFTPTPKDQIDYPLTFGEVAPWVGLAVLAAAAGYGLYRHIAKIRRRKAEAVYHDPAHIVALRKLDSFRGDKYWEASKQKVFYSGVTDALREYIAARYNIGAMEMTTSEIFRALKIKESGIPEDLRAELQSLFERSDYVKFAKYVATEQENASVLPLSVRFVTSTYQEVIEGENRNVL